MASAGGLQPKRGRSKRCTRGKYTAVENQDTGDQTKRPFPVGSDGEGNYTSGEHRTKRSRTKTVLPGTDVEENQEKHTSSPLSQSNRFVSNENGGHQTIGGPSLQVYTRAKINTAQVTKANDWVHDRKIDRVGLRELNPDTLNQFLDIVHENTIDAHNLAITKWVHASRSLLEERSSALQKNNELWSLRLQVAGQSMIQQLEAALVNFDDEVDIGFNTCLKELKVNKHSFDEMKRSFGSCLQEMRRIKSETPVLIVDLHKTSGKQDSSEKGAQLNEANGQVCGIKSSPQPAQIAKPFPGCANDGSHKSLDRQSLFRQISQFNSNRQISYHRKIPVIWNEVSLFLDRKEAAHGLEIENLRAQCHSLHEDKSVLKKINDILQNDNEQLNLSSKELCQKVITQLENAEKFVHVMERVFGDSYKALKTAKFSTCRLKGGFNLCVQQVRQVLTSVHQQNSPGEHDIFVQSKTDHGNGEMNGICGSYTDDAGTPALLQDALSSVKLTMIRLEKAISKTKTGDLQTSEAGPDILFARPNHTGYHVRSVMYTLLFEGFENESFNTLHGVSRFLDPNLRQQNFYEYYLRERLHCYTDDIEDPQFEEFCQVKISSLLRLLLPDCIATGMKINSLEELGDPQLSLSFREAAASVWLLHKLAFCFDPPATIFRVAAGVDVDPKYMEMIIDLDDSEGMVSKVAFMISPGLRLRKTIMPCEVYPCLVKSTL